MFKRILACVLLFFCIFAVYEGTADGESSAPSGSSESSDFEGSAEVLEALKTANAGGALTDKLDKIYSSDKSFHGSVLIAQNGKVLLCKGYGMADSQNSVACTTTTKFAVGSMTKQFTAMAVMQLYAQGKLDIGDKLSKYLPGYALGDKITLRNLLTHTSGLRDYINNDWKELSALPIGQLTAENIVGIMEGKPLYYEPDKTFHYCNTNYLMLGYIVEKVSGMSYSDYLKKYIFDPLGMKNTGVDYSDGKTNYTAVGYQLDTNYQPTVDGSGNFLWGEESYSNDKLMQAMYGAGSLYSTVEDLYLWDQALYTDQLLPQEYRDMMFTSQVNIGAGDAYGFGWRIADNSGCGKIVWHDGLIQGFTSCIYRFVDKDATAIILTNTDGAAIPRKAIEQAFGWAS